MTGSKRSNWHRRRSGSRSWREREKLKELRKKNPTQRLDEAYSLKAGEKRREDAQQDGKPKKKQQKSNRRGSISTAEKLTAATHEADILPGEYSLSDC